MIIYKRFLIGLYIVVISMALDTPGAFAASWKAETIGNATFTFTANKKGNTKVSFTSNGLKKKINVKVK